MADLRVRRAQPGDVALILRFIRELADYERAPGEVAATASRLDDTLFGEGATAHALICERGDAPIGFAVYFYTYSTWLARYGLYLEDLYVSPAARGAGAGKALLIYLAQKAVAEGCGRFEWNVLDWNAPAIEFYTAMGAQPQSGWTIYRVAGPALAALADRAVGAETPAPDEPKPRRPAGT